MISHNAEGGLRWVSSAGTNEQIGYRGRVIQVNGNEEVQIPASNHPYFRSPGNNRCGSDTICP